MIITHVWPRGYCFSFESGRTIYYDTPIDAIRSWLQCTGGNSMAQPAVNYTPLTPLSFLVRSAYVFPDKTAVVYKNTRYTYRQLRQRVNRCATALQAAGVRPGDRVAFLCPNIPPMLEAHYSVPLAGGVLVAINTRLSTPEIAYIPNHSGAKDACVDTELAELIQPIREQLPMLETVVNSVDGDYGKALTGPDYETFLATGADVLLDKPVEDENETIS